MATVPTPFPVAVPITPTPGGLQFKDAAPLLCGVVDNGVDHDDPRVLKRLNEATKIILDTTFPVGGQATANVAAVDEVLLLPPQMENIIECHPLSPTTKVRGSTDIAQGWYEIVGNSVFLDSSQQNDNPTIDLGLWPDPSDPSILRRAYQYPGLQPSNAIVSVTGAKRYLPLTNDEDYLIVQNIEALKCIILSIERYENNAVDAAQKYRQSGLEMIQAETKKHILDPRNMMFRKSGYHDDLTHFPPNTLGYVRAQIALDIDEAMKTGKGDLTWSINKVEQRIMQRGIFKDCIVQVQADVQGGIVYFPLYVDHVLAVDLNGSPIPIRSQFFEHLENGPGMFACSDILKDLGDEYFPGTLTTRRKYKLIANCDTTQCLNAVCKVRWLEKKPADLMVIKNYEAIRLMMTAKFLEEKEDWKNAMANQQVAFDLLDKELRDYLGGTRHTVHIQCYGFGLGDVGNYWSM
jgi:hypothetical protein